MPLRGSLALRNACAISLFSAMLLYASLDRGIIQGVVEDPQGAVLPGAAVVVTNTATNVKLELTTNSEGFYLAAELVPGNYSVHVLATGFAPINITGAVVKAGVTSTVNARLELGAVTQSVSVSAEAPLLQTGASNFSTTLEEQYIQSIPLEGRDIQSLVQLIPGVTQSSGPSAAIFGFNSEFGGFPDPLHIVGSTVSANGGQGGANQWYLDGTPNISSLAGNVVVNPSPDAVAEFNVVDNGLAAEWGRTSGAVVNIALKSGTNTLHGDIYEFNQNSYFSATNPFARRDASGRPFLQPRVNWNDFGGTLGGPINLPHIYNGRNRTFFFISWDTAILHENKPTILTVPLPQEKLGNFTGDPRFATVCGANGATNCLYDPYSTTGPDANGVFHRTSFPTPVIPSTRIDPLAAFYLSSYPNPNFVDPLQQGPTGCGIYCNNFIGPVGSSQTTHNVSVKIDHNISNKHQLFVEWLFNPSYYDNFRYPWNGPTAQTQTGLNGAQPYTTQNHIVTLGLTSSFSPTLVNEARAMFNRQAQVADPNPDSVVDNTDVLKHVQGLNFILFAPQQVVPDIGIGGLGGFGPQQWQNVIQGTDSYTFLDNVTKILGKHSIKAGMSFRLGHYWNEGAWGYGLNFGGGLTADPVTGQGGSGLAQFLLGAVDQGSGTGTFHAPYQSNDDWSFFVQDEFRVTRNFTINVGLRYDIFGWYRERHNDLANFNFNATNPDVPFPGRIDYFGTPAHPESNVFPAYKDDLGPRLTFAWSPTDKTVVRGGYGIVYSNASPSSAFGYMNAGSAPGFANYFPYNGDFTGQRPAFQLSSGAPDLNLPSTDYAKQANLQFLGTPPGAITRGSKDAYVEQWSLFIQRQIPGNAVASVGYVGAHGLHLSTDWSRNYNHIPTAVRQQLRTNITLPVPVNAALAPIYDCSLENGQAMCPGDLVLRRYPQYQSIGGIPNGDGFNRYNAMQARVEKRYSQGLNFLVAYTIAKNIQSANTGALIANGTTPTLLGRGVGRVAAIPGAAGGAAADNYVSAGAENPDDRNRYVGLAPDDIPQILNLAATYDLPVGKGKHFAVNNRVLNALVGGWSLTQNWNFQSGAPMLIFGPCNGIGSCRPDLVGNPSAGRSSSKAAREDQWWNPSAFQANFGSDPGIINSLTTGVNPDGSVFNYNAYDPWWTFGNEGTNCPKCRAPGFWNVDASLAKNFHFTESRYLQFRWQLLNALNHQNLGIPDNHWCLPPGQNGEIDLVHQFGCQFGKITNVQTDPRAMQFGVKLIW